MNIKRIRDINDIRRILTPLICNENKFPINDSNIKIKRILKFFEKKFKSIIKRTNMERLNINLKVLKIIYYPPLHHF